MKIGVVSLGCDKNRIDTENMLAFLQEDGHVITQNPIEAEIIIINTCAFIESAKAEAIDTILEMSEYKKVAKCKYLVVTGCLPQRYMDDLYKEIPEVDLFVGTTSYHMLPEYIREMIKTSKRSFYINDKNDRYFSSKRILTTPSHYAYIKIAEGCDNKCTYCAIPNIRGRYTSRAMEDIISEAEMLVNEYGVKEIILVAQDVSKFGQDKYNCNKLVDILEHLCRINVEWIRLLYLYPENITDELLDFMATNKKMCKYLDIPLQHASDKILKLMNRRITQVQIENLFKRIEKYNCFTIRSTFIVGFPQEDESDFEILKDFIKKGKIDRCGFFTYSKEDGTPAVKIKGHLPESIKIKRQKELYKIQQEIMVEKLKKRINTICEVIYEDIDYDKQMFVGRTQSDAPEIDTKVYFTSKEPVDIGNIYKVKIDRIEGLDCIGEKI